MHLTALNRHYENVPRAKKPKKPIEHPRLPRTFDADALTRAYHTYRQPSFLGGWTIGQVHGARDAHLRGQFRQSVLLVTKMLTDAAMYAASLNRLAPHRGLPRTIKSDVELTGTAANILAEAIATYAVDTSSGLPPSVLADDFEHTAWYGLNVDQVHWIPRPDGSRLDGFVSSWPLSSTEWSVGDCMFIAHTNEGRVPIVHGDGRWILSQYHAEEPWRHGAVVPLAAVLTSRPFAVNNRSSNAQSHGEDKWIGTMPEGVPILDKEGNLSPEAEAFIAQMEKLYDFRRVLLKAHGSELEREEAMGQNWQIFKEIIESDNKDAKCVLLGQDGTMTNTGGDYVKSWGLFGVRNDIVERDIATIGSSVSTGLLRPWSLMNFGRWDRLQYQWVIPDADQDARVESVAKRRAAFWEEIEAAKRNHCIVDQPYIERIAKAYSIDPPKLAPPPAALPSDSAPTITPARQPLRPARAS